MGIFDSLEAQNWMRQWKAVFITRNAILPVVKSKAKQLHTDITKKIAQTTNICLQDHGKIFDFSILSCRFHEIYRDEIKHLHKQRPSWKNASTDSWYNNEFSIAKLFMQPSGYEDKTSFEQIDFNGIAAFIFNCGCFPATVVASSDQARVSINKIRHMPDMCSIALTDIATKDCIDNLTKLLNEPIFKGDRDVQEALTQLGQLKTAFPKLLGDHWKYIIEDIATKCLQDIHELCKDEKEFLGKVADEKRSDFQLKADCILSELTLMGETVCDDIKKLIEVSQKAIAKSIKQGIKVIEENGEASERKLKVKTKIGEEKLEKKTKLGEQILKEKTEIGEEKVEKKTVIGEGKLEGKTDIGEGKLEEKTIIGEGKLQEKTVIGKGKLEEIAEIGKGKLEEKTEQGEQNLMKKIDQGGKILKEKTELGERKIYKKTVLGEEKLDEKTVIGEGKLEEKIVLGREVLKDQTKLGERKIDKKTEIGEGKIDEKTELGEQKLEENTKIGEKKLEVKTELGEQKLEEKTELGERKVNAMIRELDDKRGVLTKSELRKELFKLYKDTARTMCIRLDIDVALE